jgi:hypothetical protein
MIKPRSSNWKPEIGRTVPNMEPETPGRAQSARQTHGSGCIHDSVLRFREAGGDAALPRLGTRSMRCRRG